MIHPKRRRATYAPIDHLDSVRFEVAVSAAALAIVAGLLVLGLFIEKGITL